MDIQMMEDDVSYQFYRVLTERASEIKFLQYGQFVDVNIFQFGKEKCHPMHYFGPAVRNHYLFHYVLSGSGTLESTDRMGDVHTYSLHAGDGFLIMPGQINTYRADKKEPWEYMWLEFDGASISQPLISAGLDYDHPVWDPADKKDSQDLQQVMFSMLDSHDESSYRLIGLAYLFLDILLRSGKKDTVKPTNKAREYYIDNAVGYIEKYYSRDVSVGEIADACGLNRSYFTKIFKESMGMTPQQFLMRYRMSQACSLLKHSKVSVKDIGAAVGYPDQLHFSRAFKSTFNISPREWRNQNMHT